MLRAGTAETVIDIPSANIDKTDAVILNGVQRSWRTPCTHGDLVSRVGHHLGSSRKWRKRQGGVPSLATPRGPSASLHSVQDDSQIALTSNQKSVKIGANLW